MLSIRIARYQHFCCRWRKNRAARGGFARSGALGQPGAGHGLAGGVLFFLYQRNQLYMIILRNINNLPALRTNLFFNVLTDRVLMNSIA